MDWKIQKKISEAEEKKIRAFLEKYKITYDEPISTSNTDYGISHYLYVINGLTGEKEKVRISDHEASNVYRMQNEIMLRLNDESFEKLEKIVHPERFDITEKTIMVKVIGKGMQPKIIRKYKRKEEIINPEVQLKEMIKKNLQNCNSVLTPTICTLKNTPEGFASLEKEIFDRCAASGKTVGQVILDIEKEYSANNLSM